MNEVNVNCPSFLLLFFFISRKVVGKNKLNLWPKKAVAYRLPETKALIILKIIRLWLKLQGKQISTEKEITMASTMKTFLMIMIIRSFF